MAHPLKSVLLRNFGEFFEPYGWGNWSAFEAWTRKFHGSWHRRHQDLTAQQPQDEQSSGANNWSALLNEEARNVDGTGNNLTDTNLGSAGSQLLRVSSASYADGAGAPNSGTNPRDISNTILDQDALIKNSFGASDLFTYFGQFIDHDIDLTTEGGTETMGFTHADGDFEIGRSGYVGGTGTGAGNPREYPNVITSYVDASNIYGSHADVTAVLRADGGTSPYLLTSDDDFAPTLGEIIDANPGLDPNNVGGGPLAVGGMNPSLFVAGDVRANENIALTSMHTIWIREHNYQVDKFKELMPDASNEELFKVARLIVEAEYQNIVFNEYLPLLLGAENIPDYAGYDPNVDPNVAIEFSTAAYRLGHSQISPTLARRNEDGSESDEGDLPLFQAFFRPDQLLNGGIDALVRGLGAQKGQEIDENIVDDVRNLLFGGTHADPIDLGVFNILRGYDHGIPSLNEVRVAYKLDPLADFSELTSDPALAAQFAQVYASIDEVDLWVGGLGEDKFPGSQLGETFHTIVMDQFMRFRDGDRFFFEERLQEHPELLDFIKETTLSDILLRNTDIDYFQDDAFIAHNRIGGGNGQDKLYGTDEHDLMIGFGGRDKLLGRQGDDDLYGGAGRDKLLGNRGDDLLDGESGRDMLFGGRGDDDLRGGDGRDILKGGRGDDILDGGAGRDTLMGGDGADTFVLRDADAWDYIIDFEQEDLIDLTDLLDVLDTDCTPGLSQGDADAAVRYFGGRLYVADEQGCGYDLAAKINMVGFGLPSNINVLVDDSAGNEATFAI